MRDRFAQRMGQPQDQAATEARMAQAVENAAPQATAEVRSSLTHLASDITSFASNRLIPMLRDVASQGKGLALQGTAHGVTLSIETVNYLLQNPWIIQASMGAAYLNGSFAGLTSSFLPDSFRAILAPGAAAH